MGVGRADGREEGGEGGTRRAHNTERNTSREGTIGHDRAHRESSMPYCAVGVIL